MIRHQYLATADEVAHALCISARQVRSLARRRAIPSIPLGYRTIRFDLTKVREAIAAREIRAIK